MQPLEIDYASLKFIPESEGKRTMSVLASEVVCAKSLAAMQTIIKSIVSKCWYHMRKEIWFGLCKKC